MIIKPEKSTARKAGPGSDCAANSSQRRVLRGRTSNATRTHTTAISLRHWQSTRLRSASASSALSRRLPPYKHARFAQQPR